MAIKKYVAISYCFIILSIYSGSIAYAFISSDINKNYNKEILPQTIAMNSTVTALSSVSSWGGIVLTIGIIAIILTILFIILGTRAMGAAI